MADKKEITKCSECPSCNPNYSQTSLICDEMVRRGVAQEIKNIDIRPAWCPLSKIERRPVS